MFSCHFAKVLNTHCEEVNLGGSVLIICCETHLRAPIVENPALLVCQSSQFPKKPETPQEQEIDGLIEAFSLTKKVLKKNEHGSQKCQKICRQELQEDKSTGGNSTTRRIRHCRENDVFKLAGKTTNLSMLIFSRGETWGKGLKFVVYGPLKDGAKFDSRV